MILQLMTTFSWLVKMGQKWVKNESKTVFLAQEIDEMCVWDVLNTDWFLIHAGV